MLARRLDRRPLSRLWAMSLLTLATMAPFACRSKSRSLPGGRPAGSAAPSASHAAAEAGPCRDVSGAQSLLLGTGAAEAPASDDEREVDLPFSVELGRARAASGTFVVGGLDHRGGESHAFVARVSAANGEGRSLDLGRVFGDVEPPALVPFRDRILIAVANSDAGGVTLRIASLAPPFTAQGLRRGSEVTSVRRDASGFALEASGDRVLLAFTRLERGRGRIGLAIVDPDGPGVRGVVPAPEPLAPAEADLQGPRLAPRASGYYLAYIAHTPGARKAARLELDGGTSETLLDEGPSAIEIVPVDAEGRGVAPPRRITPPGAKVIAFDLVAAPGGGALVTYRDDQEGPGLDRSSLQAVHVRADGSSETRTWDVGENPGLAAVLVDTEPAKAGPWAWFDWSDEQSTRLSALGADPLAFGQARPLAPPGVELLAVSGGRFLGARSRGRQRQLTIWACPP